LPAGDHDGSGGCFVNKMQPGSEVSNGATDPNDRNVALAARAALNYFQRFLRGPGSRRPANWTIPKRTRD